MALEDQGATWVIARLNASILSKPQTNDPDYQKRPTQMRIGLCWVPLVDTRVGKGLSSFQTLSCDLHEKQHAGVNLLFTQRTIYCLGVRHPRTGRDDLSTLSKLLASEVVNLTHSLCWSDRGRH